MPFRVKICGITTVQDAAIATNAGADAIGLNFYKESPRCVAVPQAAEISESLPTGSLSVGVFVNSTADEVVSIAEQVGLRAIQLHGDEPAKIIKELPAELPVIRAWRLGTDGLGSLCRHLEEARFRGRRFDAVLIDARVEGAYGGTGATADWELVAQQRQMLDGTPLILAGGLTPTNVAEALRATGADGVDTASGVETAPGIKSPELVGEFVKSSLAEFASLGHF